MHPDFWLERWRERQIGFHQEAPTPLLLEFWPALGVAPGTRVFVPLCGKSHDLAWLAAQGHRVLGVELSPLAIAEFFADHGLAPHTHASPLGLHHVAGDIEIIEGDAFGLDADSLAGCGAVFDRAALIALPPPLRERYARELYARLPPGCRGLLVSLDYPAHEKQGPPFPVPPDEVRALYGADWELDLLAYRDILAAQPRFREEGVTALNTGAWRLRRR
jgi:thiopurine S-methyltransferase